MFTDAKDNEKDFEDFFVSSRDSSLRLPDSEKKKAGGVVAAAVAVVPIDLDRYGHGALPLRRRLNWSVTTTTTTTIWIFLWIGADKKSFKTLKEKKLHELEQKFEAASFVGNRNRAKIFTPILNFFNFSEWITGFLYFEGFLTLY